MIGRFVPGLLVAALVFCTGSAQTVVRAGAFPNITHAQAMVGKANRLVRKGG